MEYVLRYLKLPSVKSLKTIMKSLCLLALGILVFIGNPQNGNAQQFNLNKTVSTTNPNTGEVFNYIINASCSSSTQDCESVVITDPLPPTLEYLGTSFPWPDGVADVVYDPLAHELTITFDASSANCPSCTPDGINTDNDDFSQGSSIQLTVQVLSLIHI